MSAVDAMDDRIRRELARPLARAYALACGRVNASDAARDLLGVFESLVQCHCLTGAVRGLEARQKPSAEPADPAVPIQTALAGLGSRPSLGTWWQTLQRVHGALTELGGAVECDLDARCDDLGFLGELHRLIKPGERATRLTLRQVGEGLIQLRNDASHGRLSTDGLARVEPALRATVRHLLLAFHGAGARTLVVVAQSVRRGGRREVSFQTYRGEGEPVLRRVLLPPEVDPEHGAVYLLGPGERDLLLLSPFFAARESEIHWYVGHRRAGGPIYCGSPDTADSPALLAAADELREHAPFLFVETTPPAPDPNAGGAASGGGPSGEPAPLGPVEE